MYYNTYRFFFIYVYFKGCISKVGVLLIALVALFGVFGVYAYLTDTTDTVTNTFTIGNVDITLTEPNWNADNAKNITSGQIITKDPTITNTGSNSAYVYMKVEEPIVSLSSGSTGTLFTYTTNTGWTVLSTSSTDATKTTVYYYNSALAVNATATLFDSVTVNDFANTVTGDQTMNITGYAIQSDNLPDETTIATAYDLFTK